MLDFCNPAEFPGNKPNLALNLQLSCFALFNEDRDIKERPPLVASTY